MRDFPNLRHMRVFLETVRSGSVSVAADLCNLSQPAATQALAKLEEVVGTALLLRQRREFVATPCGAAFAPRAERTLSLLKDGALAAARLGGKPTRRASFDAAVTVAQLRTLTAIANTGSFTLAAKALEVSQPTVHRAARALEALAAVPLFAARPSGVVLTPSAEAFARAVKLAQTEMRQAQEEISRILGDDRGTFVLGSMPLARTAIVPQAVKDMVTAFENVQVRVVDGRYPHLLRSLREGELDCLIGALRDPHPAEDVVQEVLFEDALSVVAHPSHPLAGRRITWEETLTYPWIAPPKDTPAGQYLFEALRIQDQPQSPVRVVSSSMVLLRGLLAEGPFISIVSRKQIAIEEANGAIGVLDVPLTGHHRQIGLTYRRDWQATETQKRFLDYLRHHAVQ